MITDEGLERALDYLRDSATEAAQARANRLHLDDYSRVLKATIMAEHLAETIGAQERWAYSDIRYKNHLEGLKVSIFEDEKHRYLREAASAKIEIWRSEQANARAERI